MRQSSGALGTGADVSATIEDGFAIDYVAAAVLKSAKMLVWEKVKKAK